MLYMVIERFKTPGAIDVYRRAKNGGRSIPDGLEYVASWVDMDFNRCWQLMKTDDIKLFDPWIAHWSDLVEFEVVQIRTSAEAMAIIAPKL